MLTRFLQLTISPPLIQQLQPQFLRFRELYSSREANSKIYSWVAFCIGATVVELPYSILAGTIVRRPPLVASNFRYSSGRASGNFPVNVQG